MQRHAVLTAVLLAACARGRSDEPVVDSAAAIDAVETADAAPRSDSAASVCASPFTGTLATWSFAAETGLQTMTVAATNAHDVIAGAVTRAASLTAVSGAGSINASGWALTATRDATKYYALTLSPPSGCAIVLTGAMLDAKSSGTGPVSAQIATSADGFTAAASVSTTAASNVVLTATATGPIELRVYGYAATAAGGTMRLQGSLAIAGELK